MVETSSSWNKSSQALLRPSGAFSSAFVELVEVVPSRFGSTDLDGRFIGVPLCPLFWLPMVVVAT